MQSTLPFEATERILHKKAVPLERSISLQFARYVKSLPWAGTTGLDWQRMPPSISINVAESTSEELATWIDSSRLGKHAFAAVWYSENQGGIVILRSELAQSLDALCWGSERVGFVFAMDRHDPLPADEVSIAHPNKSITISEINNDHGYRPDFFALLQWSFGDVLIATS